MTPMFTNPILTVALPGVPGARAAFYNGAPAWYLLMRVEVMDAPSDPCWRWAFFRACSVVLESLQEQVSRGYGYEERDPQLPERKTKMPGNAEFVYEFWYLTPTPENAEEVAKAMDPDWLGSELAKLIDEGLPKG